MNVLQLLREFPRANEYMDFNERARDQWVAEIARQLPAGTRILDVGAGPCRYRNLFSHCHYEAQDFAQYEGTAEGVNADPNWGYGELDYISDITAIPVPDGSFDAILCTEVLEHVPEPIRAIQEMARILKPGGRLFLTAPLGSGIHQAPYHFYGGYTPYFYQTMLPRFGIEVAELKPNGGFFKHYLQESGRAARLITEKQHFKRYSPIRLALGLLFLRLIPVIFFHLDDTYPVEAHTVGYFVSALKREELPPRRSE